MTEVSEITNYAGDTYRIGDRVRHSDGWTGTITRIRVAHVDLLCVEPDDMDALRGYDRERTLSADAAAQAGRPTFCQPRDHGKSMGNYSLLGA